MPPQDSSSSPLQPTTRLEPPFTNQPLAENTMDEPATSPQPTTQIKAPVVPPSPPAPPLPPSPKSALFWSLVSVVATLVVIGAGFYIYGMFLSRNAPAPAPETAKATMRECGNDTSCITNAVATCAPARATVSVDDALASVIARSVMDIAVNGVKSDASCDVLITQKSYSAALPDSFFDAAKIPEAERGALIERFANDNAEPNVILGALSGLTADCSLSTDGAGALATYLLRFRELEYSTSINTTTGTATPVTIAKIGGVPVDINFWRECSGPLAENRPKALEDAASLVKVEQ